MFRDELEEVQLDDGVSSPAIPQAASQSKISEYSIRKNSAPAVSNTLSPQTEPHSPIAVCCCFWKRRKKITNETPLLHSTPRPSN